MKMFEKDVRSFYLLCSFILALSVHEVSGWCYTYGRFGVNCRSQCHCGSGSEDCDRNTGVCITGQPCAAGYHGSNCQTQCFMDYYGDCSTRCSEHCLSVTKGQRKCNVISGFCTNTVGCQPGYRQSKCDQECVMDYYGDCSTRCSEHCLSVTRGQRKCNVISGICTNTVGCQPGYRQSKCDQECVMDYYGDCSTRCSEHCLSVTRGQRKCNVISGFCTNTVGCQPGYRQSKCDQECVMDYYGDCSTRCSEHCLSVTRGQRKCNVISGICTNTVGCQPGYRQSKCDQECAVDYYGDCSTRCSEHCLSVTQGQKKCNVISGFCTNTGGCQPGYQHSKCDQKCPMDYYGDCMTRCSEPFLSVTGGQRKCNFISDFCTNTGRCQPECSNITYGDGCQNNCSDHCIIVPSSERVCSHETGACTNCKLGYNGTKCDQRCLDGYYGNTCKFTCSEHCVLLQNSSIDICDYKFGECLSGCNPGYQGSLCIDVCNSPKYASACNSTCNEHCQSTDNGEPICHHVSGNCTSGCQDGYLATNESECTKIALPMFSPRDESGSSFGGGQIAGVVIGCLIAIALLGALLLIFMLRRRKAGRSKSADQNGTRTNSALYIADPNNASIMNRSTVKGRGSAKPDIVVSNETAVDVTATSLNDDDGDVYYNDLPARTVSVREGIDVNDLWDYVVEQKRVGGLKAEYEKLPAGLVHEANAAVQPENKGKSRYLNIYAYDHTRILLDVTAESTHTDYINANYVPGYQNPKKYIASQGPNAIIIDDFWRMVWQENCSKIVVLTRLVESGKMKCDQYWPDSGSKDYGNIIVKMIQVDEFADFTIRTLQVKHTQLPDKRIIKQFHFMSWPDHGVPDYPTALVSFRDKVTATSSSTTGPVVIHCSAGIGRTGTYAGLDFLIEQAKAEGRVDIFGCIQVLRYYRVNMIQTAEQYEFLHDALLEALNLSDLSMPSYEFMDKYANLKHVNSRSGKTYLQEQFELLNLLSRSDKVDEFTSAKLPENINKHRDRSVMAADNHRVYLTTLIPDTNNYINAVYLPGYKESKAFIITQMPLSSTVIDFWRMIYENKCCTIVMLNNDNVQDGACYWSNDDTPMNIGPFKITSKLDVEGDLHNDISIELTNEDKADDILKIRLFQCKFWPKSEKVPPDASLLITLLEDVEHWQQQSGISTTVVHCLNGAEKSGVYCTISAVIDRLKIEQQVNISQTIKQLRIRRPQIINCMDQYQFCHDAVIAYLENFQTYSNFK